MKIGVVAALVLSAIAAFSVVARAGRSDGNGPLLRVRIETSDPAALRAQLESGGYDVLRAEPPDSTVELVVSRAELHQLQSSGLSVIVIEEGRPLLETFQERAAIVAVPATYRDLDGIINRMHEIAAANPAIAQVVDVTATYGTPPTFEGRHLFALKISDNVAVDEDEPAVLIVSTHHAREIVAPVIALNAAERLVGGYGSDPRITSAVNNHAIWIAPVWNPDGYRYVFTVDNLWRKNRRVLPTGVGIDQNRNYPQGWGAPCSGSTAVSSLVYKGPTPASEAETQTMMTWSLNQRFAKIIDYHSYGREVLYSYNCLGHPFTSWMQQEAAAISRASGYGGATRAPSGDGEHQEWQFAQMGAYAFLIETHTQFQPPYTSALNEAAMVWPGILSVIERPISVSGHVTDAVSGAALEARIELLNVTFSNGETNSSGGRYGRYQMVLPPGNYDVRFSKPGYVPVVQTVSVTSSSAAIMDIQLPPADTTPPVRSGGRPTGALPAGTTQTTLALTTSEAAACRYSSSAGVPYDSMPQTFATTGGTAHSTPVSGLVDGRGYAFYVRCLDAAANANPDDFAITFTVDTPPADTTPPVRSGGRPTGALPAGTTQTTLALTTNEAAGCRYSPSAGVSYDAMTLIFATTGGTAHSTPVSGLVDGRGYAFYVRCLDAAANANSDDFAITFTVDSPPDTTPPVRSGGQPMGTLPAGTTQTTLALTTNEAAGCRYSSSAGVPYDSMPQTFATTGGTAHSTPVSGLVDGRSYAFYVRCLDAAANADSDDFAITFTVDSPPDTTPPVRSGGQPMGTLPAGTTQTTLALTTNEAAVCRYSPSAGAPYDAMTQTFATTGGTAHSTPVSGLVDGRSYAFYVRCLDAAANANSDDFAISFTVDNTPTADTTPPARSGGQPMGTLPAGTTQTTLALTTNEAATCRYNPTAGVPYDAMTQTFATTGSTAHSTPVSGLVDGGSYAFYVRCLDAAANTDPDDFAIAFTVDSAPPDTTPPVRSGGQPMGALPAGTTQTTLALTTNEAATCRYSPSAGVPYDAMTQTFATTGGTAHSTPVSGLVDGGSYAFYVRCLDAAANASPDDFAIAFTVDSPADTAPRAAFSVFADDFETDQGWTRNPKGTDTATTGLWERGDPQATALNGPKQLGTTASGANCLVTGRLAGSSVGTHDIDGGVTSIRSPAIALPVTGQLTLSFSYYLAHASNSSSADFLRVQIVGSTPATVFEKRGAATNADAVWRTASVSLNSFAGQTIWILIEAADGGGASLVEAAIDDIAITQQ